MGFSPSQPKRGHSKDVREMTPMRAIILIGVNYLRTQVLTVLIIVVYLAGMAVVFLHNPRDQEARFFVQLHPDGIGDRPVLRDVSASFAGDFRSLSDNCPAVVSPAGRLEWSRRRVS